MKDQYFGDENDFRKYGMLQSLYQATGLSLAVCWMLMFMAPEQWLQGPVDRRTDIYSLGAAAHLMATGHPPFRGRTTSELAIAHTQQPYVAPESTTPEEAYFFAVVGRTLQKDPERRYATGEAMAQALDTVAEAPLALHQEARRVRVGNVAISLEKGDISEITCDVIVNAANWAMVMDAGVSAALAWVGGTAIEAEAVKSAPSPMGAVVWTGAGNLKAKWVAHAVAALDGAICLQRCTLRALIGAEERRAGSIAFPALGTGIGQVPMSLGAHMMLEALRTFAELRPRHVQEVRFVLYDADALKVWQGVLDAMCWPTKGAWNPLGPGTSDAPDVEGERTLPT